METVISLNKNTSEFIEWFILSDKLHNSIFLDKCNGNHCCFLPFFSTEFLISIHIVSLENLVSLSNKSITARFVESAKFSSFN